MKDTEIISHLRNNKYSPALKGLYKTLPTLKRYILANSGTADDAADIFQDALVILYKKIQMPDMVFTVPLKTYLLAIARNCWMQELRRRKKLRVNDALPDIAPEEDTKETNSFATATVAFQLLGEKCKALLLLFYYHKKSFKEIAVTLAFSDEKIAKNQKYRCLQKAKENYLTLSNNGSHE